jgi:putative ATPase
MEGDLESLFRRLSVIAYEDIGLANPNIYPRLDAAYNAAIRVGLPEARIPIGTIVTEMALSPKSNTAHVAFDEALADIENGNVGKIPNHIKTDSNDYKYPHNYPGAFVKQQYLPDIIKDKKYYQPKDIGYEKNIKEVYEKIEKLKSTND